VPDAKAATAASNNSDNSTTFKYGNKGAKESKDTSISQLEPPVQAITDLDLSILFNTSSNKNNFS